MRIEKSEEGIAPILFFSLAVFALIITLVSLIGYISSRSDYAEVCALSSPPEPRCASDLNGMTFNETLAVVGFSLMFVGLYLIRPMRPIFLFFVVVTLILGLLFLYVLL